MCLLFSYSHFPHTTHSFICPSLSFSLSFHLPASIANCFCLSLLLTCSILSRVQFLHLPLNFLSSVHFLYLYHFPLLFTCLFHPLAHSLNLPISFTFHFSLFVYFNHFTGPFCFIAHSFDLSPLPSLVLSLHPRLHWSLPFICFTCPFASLAPSHHPFHLLFPSLAPLLLAFTCTFDCPIFSVYVSLHSPFPLPYPF